MNAARAGIVASILFPLACAAGLGARMEELRSGSYSPDFLGQIAQPALAPGDDQAYSVLAYPTFALQLADGPGRAQTQIHCSSCHTARYITMQPPLPAATWDAEVQKMIKTYGAQIPAADAQAVIQYLKAHYTPETRK